MTIPSRFAASSSLSRRSLLGATLGAAIGQHTGAHAQTQTQLVFPRDAGAHPDYKTEWWYATGCINGEEGNPLFGFQVTFFRSKIATTQGMKSRLAARQLIFGHAAVTDIRGKKLWHDQRVARASGAEPGQNPLDVASASTQDTRIALKDWSLVRQENGHLRAQVQGADFSMAFSLVESQPVLLQGVQGLSQKGPDSKQTSYYYSLPHLQVTGELNLQGKRHTVGAGSLAWLDHEWSQEIMPPQAIGWDWIGINLINGDALTAFHLRDKAGNAVWDGGSFRTGGKLLTYSRGDVAFKPLRIWKSPLSAASYPVEWVVRTPTDHYTVRAVLDNQEMDSRMSTGAIYWEGLCEVWNSNQKLVGRGYLEMTGYAAPMQL